MYAIVEDNNITQYINFPKSVVIGDVRYPAKIFQLWSQSEKEAIGIYEIIVDKTNYKDPAYYNNTNSTYTFADGQVTESWGTATPKRLNDENAVDENGDPLLDENGDQVVNYGLKTKYKNQFNAQAKGLLEKTDWYVIKATDVESYSVPSNITTYRSQVRAKVNSMETDIDDCSTVEELITLLTYTMNDEGVSSRPLGEFPDEVV